MAHLAGWASVAAMMDGLLSKLCWKIGGLLSMVRPAHHEKKKVLANSHHLPLPPGPPQSSPLFLQKLCLSAASALFAPASSKMVSMVLSRCATECSPPYAFVHRRGCHEVVPSVIGANISSLPSMLQQPLQPGLWRLSRRPAWRPPLLQEGERRCCLTHAAAREQRAAGASVGGGGRFGARW